MGKKGKKTRWRRLPIGGSEEEGGLSLEPPPPTTDPHRVTFNEDEYTKITTPRQDVLFKKGYFGRKRNPLPSPTDAQDVHSGDSVESESYVSEEAQYVYPAGYMDPTGVYYVNGNTFETYDPYTGTVTVVVGPPAPYPGGPPVLAAVPCQPVPLQPVEWFNPAAAPWCYPYNRRKRYSTDSQNCSAQSSESTGPPGSPQEPVDEGACAMYPPPIPPQPQYVYPGYMFGPPIYNMNGMTVQGVIPQPVPVQPDTSASKRRKKRRRRRRGGMTDDGSESSCCEEPLTCDVPGCQSETSSDAVCQSGASSDAGVGPGSSSSKANSDSGINTDPTPNSGSNSPPPQELAQQIETIDDAHFECPALVDVSFVREISTEEETNLSIACTIKNSLPHPDSLNLVDDSGCETKAEESQCDEKTPEEASEELSTTEDEITPNLCASVPEFSSQESTLSCVSTPSVSRDVIPNEQDLSSADKFQEELFQSCQSLSERNICEDMDSLSESAPIDGEMQSQTLNQTVPDSEATLNDLKTATEDENIVIKASDNNVEDEIEIQPLKFKVHLISEIPSTTIEFESVQTLEATEGNVPFEKKEIKPIIHEDVIEIAKAIEEEYFICTIQNVEDHPPIESEYCLSRHPVYLGPDTPVPPPRRKRSLCRAADKLASKLVEDAIKEGIEEAASIGLKNPMSITEAVTRWLNSQGKLPINCTISESESEDDEGIELGESLTDQKNVRGNPFLVPSHNGMGQRVAKDCESIGSSAGEWDMWDSNHTREMCDPARSVDKYYRLGADADVADKMPPSVYKTAMHIRHSGPFPCGVCCILQ